MTCDDPTMNLDGPTFEPGSLVLALLTAHMLIDAEKPVLDPDKWIKTDFYISELGSEPTVIVLDTDPLDCYCQILLGEKKFWFPTKHLTAL